MIALAVYNVSKVYRLYRSPQDKLLEIITRKSFHKDFWAIKNVSFKVFKGETLGIIGDNGAGKSTLLKILAGVLQPTGGKIIRNGRVAALLELGTGFHPELSGRENIYLYASLLGLPEKEIREREKEIIAFAEIGDFIDQPIKTYSSGMQVRLAFSVAVQIDPDILIIDEALSVGDQRFQKKSFEKILSFCKDDKTIIFCSHSKYHILELCERVIWLHEGKIKAEGPAQEVLSLYEEYCENKNLSTDTEVNASPKEAYIKKVCLLFPKKASAYKINTGDPLELEIHCKTQIPLRVHIGAGIHLRPGESLFGISTKSAGLPPLYLEGEGIARVRFPKVNLLSGRYQAFAALLDETGLHIYDLAVSEYFQVEGPPGIYGKVLMDWEWLL